MNAAPDLLAGLRNGRWLDERDFLRLRYHVLGIGADGSTLLAGAPKIGTSWLVLDFAVTNTCAVDVTWTGVAAAGLGDRSTDILVHVVLEDVR